MNRNRQPEGIPTGGQFAASEHDEATGSLGFDAEYESPSVATTLVLEHYDGFSDFPTVIREEELDLREVLDSYSLDELPEDTEDDGQLDQFFNDAAKLGLFESHGGAYSTRINNDEYQAYINSRRAAGKDEAISEIPLHSPAESEAIVDTALLSAVPKGGMISVMNWESGAQARSWAKDAATNISESFEARGFDRDKLEEEEAEVVRAIEAISQADDRSTTSPQYLNGARRTAMLLADLMISRNREATPF